MGRIGLEGEAVVNDSPVDCQSRGRPSAQFARDRVLDGPPRITKIEPLGVSVLVFYLSLVSTDGVFARSVDKLL